jgi:hypothetical protein
MTGQGLKAWHPNKLQHGLRQVLRWIARPSIVSHDDAKSAFDFLFTQVEGIRWEVEFLAAEPPLERRYTFWFKFPMDFPSVISPLCHFIWVQMERYSDGKDARQRMLPVGLCAREACGKFFLIERAGRSLYHDGKCRSLHWQSTHKKAKNKQRVDSRIEEKARTVRGLLALMSEKGSVKGQR